MILWTARRSISQRERACTSATAPRPWCPLRWPPQRRAAALFLYLNAAGTAFMRTTRSFWACIEGPYRKSQCGARDHAFIHEAGPAEYNELLDACPHILRWTIAPRAARRTGDGAFAAGARRTANIGHSEGRQRSGACRHSLRLPPCDAPVFGHVHHRAQGRLPPRRHRGKCVSVLMSCPARSSPTAATSRSIAAAGLQTHRPAAGWCWSRTPCARGQTQGESILGSLERQPARHPEDLYAKCWTAMAFVRCICIADSIGPHYRGMLAGASLPGCSKVVWINTETPPAYWAFLTFYGYCVEAGHQRQTFAASDSYQSASPAASG